MDYETALRKLDPHQPFAFCVPLLELPAGANVYSTQLLEPERLAQGKQLPETFDVVEAGEQSWLVHDNRVVLRPAPLWHQLDFRSHMGPPSFFYTHEFSDAAEVAYQERKLHFIGTRDDSGWTVGFGAGAFHGTTFEEALRKLVPKKEEKEQAAP
jgi:hypothetical protein